MAERVVEQSNRTTNGSQVPSRGVIGAMLGFIGAVAGSIVVGLCLAIALEWIGIIWWWPGEAATHAHSMMNHEISYLNEDFRASLFASQPAVFARRCADLTYYWLFEWTGFVDGMNWLRSARVNSSPWHLYLAKVYHLLEPFVLSIVYVSETFALRIAVLIMSLPAFALFGLVGVAEGLMRRDLRRWGGGRESSLAHGVARAAIKPMLVLPWVLYLSLPISVHPNYIVLPAAVLFGIALCVASATFKKYL